MKQTRRGFTLVELLVVIGIIALLISILLPSLNRAREAARTIKCASNLRTIGQGLAMYVAENKQYFPAAYMYIGVGQASGTPTQGYRHWSSYLYGDKNKAGTGAAFRSLDGWGAFVCPSVPNGGLPPTNTFAENVGQGVTVDAPGVIDEQAPRLSYTVNEAIMPRNKFNLNYDGNATRQYRQVNAGTIKDSSNVILATEFNPNEQIGRGDGRVTPGTNNVMKSHRPVHGFECVGASQYEVDKAPYPYPGGKGYFRNYSLQTGLCTAYAPTDNRLSWIGRNHGAAKIGPGQQDLRTTNFLYVDGHVETKRLAETIYPTFQWGARFYSIPQNGDLDETVVPDATQKTTF